MVVVVYECAESFHHPLHVLGFFRIACARIAETDQPWKKVLLGFWSLAMAVLLSVNLLLDFFTGWSWFAAIGGSVVVALIVGRDET